MKMARKTDNRIPAVGSAPPSPAQSSFLPGPPGPGRKSGWFDDVDPQAFYLVFSLAGEYLGLHGGFIRNISSFHQILPFENLPEGFRGVATLSSRLVPVMDLARFLNLSRRDDQLSRTLLSVAIKPEEQAAGLGFLIDQPLGIFHGRDDCWRGVGGEHPVPPIVSVKKITAGPVGEFLARFHSTQNLDGIPSGPQGKQWPEEE